MSFWKDLFHGDKRAQLQKIRITSAGGFYMKSEDLFDDEKQALDMLKKLNESVEKHRNVKRAVAKTK